MTKLKTKDLKGAQLDWAVALAEGAFSPAVETDCDGTKYINYGGMYPCWSTDWDTGGFIIEREGIELTVEGPYVNGRVQVVSWDAMIPMFPNRVELRGNSPLVAAMRAYVHSKLGAEVEVPEELCDEDL